MGRSRVSPVARVDLLRVRVALAGNLIVRVRRAMGFPNVEECILLVEASIVMNCDLVDEE